MTVSGIPAIPDTVVKGHITSQPEDLMQGMKKFWRSFPHHTYCLFKVIFSAQNRKELKKFISVPCNGIEHKEKGSHTNMRSRGLYARLASGMYLLSPGGFYFLIGQMNQHRHHERRANGFTS